MDRRYEAIIKREAGTFDRGKMTPAAGRVTWTCPSNIAIVKYWGKRPVQIPMNPSLSMTLSEASTTTALEFHFDPDKTERPVDFRFEGRKAPAFEERIGTFVRRLHPYLPYLAHTTLKIESRNTFPHSSGIASSASAMGALALCLVQAGAEIAGNVEDDAFAGRGELRKKASFIARLGSGSAARSIYPRLALWGSSGIWERSSDEYAIPVKGFHPEFHRMKDAILIVEAGRKKVSSSAGHQLMERNPYAPARFAQAGRNLAILKEILEKGDWEDFIRLMEEEALSLHAMMMTGTPGYLLMQPGTVSILNKVRGFRSDTGCRTGFTLDAGANVHLLYAAGDAERVEGFVASDLLEHCEKGMHIMDRMGDGPYIPDQ